MTDCHGPFIPKEGKRKTRKRKQGQKMRKVKKEKKEGLSVRVVFVVLQPRGLFDPSTLLYNPFAMQPQPLCTYTMNCNRRKPRPIPLGTRPASSPFLLAYRFSLCFPRVDDLHSILTFGGVSSQTNGQGSEHKPRIDSTFGPCYNCSAQHQQKPRHASLSASLVSGRHVFWPVQHRLPGLYRRKVDLGRCKTSHNTQREWRMRE